MLDRFDHWMLDRATGAAAVVARRNGNTQWDLAREAVNVGIVLLECSFLLNILSGANYLVTGLFAMFWVFVWTRAQQRIDNGDGSRAWAMALRESERGFRMMGMTVILVFMIFATSLADVLAATGIAVLEIGRYLEACDPPPPIKRLQDISA